MKRMAPENGKVSDRKNKRQTEEPKKGEIKGREQEGLKKEKRTMILNIATDDIDMKTVLKSSRHQALAKN